MELSAGMLNHPVLAAHIKSQSCELQGASSQKKWGFCYRPFKAFKEALSAHHSVMEAITICVYEYKIVIRLLCYLC